MLQPVARSQGEQQSWLEQGRRCPGPRAGCTNTHAHTRMHKQGALCTAHTEPRPPTAGFTFPVRSSLSSARAQASKPLSAPCRALWHARGQRRWRCAAGPRAGRINGSSVDGLEDPGVAGNSAAPCIVRGPRAHMAVMSARSWGPHRMRWCVGEAPRAQGWLASWFTHTGAAPPGAAPTMGLQIWPSLWARLGTLAPGPLAGFCST